MGLIIYSNKLNWTKQAKDCYKMGCCCPVCEIYQNVFKESGYKCQMKYVVLELVRRKGIPEELIKNIKEVINEQ